MVSESPALHAPAPDVWMKHNRKWFVPLIVTAALCFILAFVGAIVGSIANEIVGGLSNFGRPCVALR